MAKGKQIKSPVTADQWKQRLQVKAVLDYGQFLKSLRKTKVLRELPGKEKGESIGLVLPEAVILETLLCGIEQRFALGLSHLLSFKPRFDLPYQVLEANRALLDLRPRACRGHE
ncbi:MAG: hypothetical protein ACREX9_11070 [Gammaproteobacteria bacterium]